MTAELDQRIVPIRSASFDSAISDVMSTCVGDVVLIGHSLGGLVALAAARAQPARVTGLALVSTSILAPRDDQRAGWLRSLSLTEGGRMQEVINELVRDSVSTTHSRNEQAVGAVVRTMAQDTGPDRFAQQLALQLSRTDQSLALRQFVGPVLILGGELDPLVPTAVLKRTAPLTVESSVRIHPQAGHYLPIEDAVWTAKQLSTWILPTI